MKLELIAVLQDAYYLLISEQDQMRPNVFLGYNILPRSSLRCEFLCNFHYIKEEKLYTYISLKYFFIKKR